MSVSNFVSKLFLAVKKFKCKFRNQAVFPKCNNLLMSLLHNGFILMPSPFKLSLDSH